MPKWRFIYTGQDDPYFNMAVDEALLSSVQAGSAPILRLYEWNPPGISIGYFQSVDKTVDLDKCQSKGVKIVRRITGGRAVLHNEELTYSFSGSCRIFPELGNSISETYRQISRALLFSLSVLGIEAQWIKPTGVRSIEGDQGQKEERAHKFDHFFNLPCFSSLSRYEISYQGKKLIGSAQRRFHDFFLQHGSILLKKGKLDLTDFLPANSIAKEPKNSTCIGEIKKNGINNQQVILALRKGFSEVFQKDFNEDSLSKEELRTADEFKINKYSKDFWNYRI
ncbi:MAG TPA: biotin/lipoate A/B protein ligase family protein [Terriglobales bacterium]|nr:biotin/lipoate A/B protein ligase family protein [Terriglobales bacterium]